MAHISPQGPQNIFFLIHRIIGAKLGQNHMQHAMLIPEIHEFSMLAKMRQRARSLDAFSHLYRDFQYRLMSTYTFSASSHHSESNDMRQPHVLTNMLQNSGTWVSDDVTTSKVAKISKSRQNLEGYPRSFFLIGSWLTKTGVKKWFQFNGHRTPDFDPTNIHCT